MDTEKKMFYLQQSLDSEKTIFVDSRFPCESVVLCSTVAKDFEEAARILSIKRRRTGVSRKPYIYGTEEVASL